MSSLLFRLDFTFEKGWFCYPVLFINAARLFNSTQFILFIKFPLKQTMQRTKMSNDNKCGIKKNQLIYNEWGIFFLMKNVWKMKVDHC